MSKDLFVKYFNFLNDIKYSVDKYLNNLSNSYMSYTFNDGTIYLEKPIVQKNTNHEHLNIKTTKSTIATPISIVTSSIITPITITPIITTSVTSLIATSSPLIIKTIAPIIISNTFEPIPVDENKNILISIDDDNKIIQSLWIGSKLSVMEKLCIKSFINNGHIFHLYIYNNIEDIPKECIVKDGNEILDRSEIFYHGESAGKSKGSIGAFSDLFRFKLLFDKGGYWVDMDMICLKYFNFGTEYVFSSEQKINKTESIVNAGVIKCPKNSNFAKYCFENSYYKDKSTLKWGEIGPAMVLRGIQEFKLERYVKSWNYFCPIHYNDIKNLMEPMDNHKYLTNSNWYGIHFWNEILRRNNYNKDKIKSKSLYEHLINKNINNYKARILITSTQYPSYGGAGTNAYYLIKFFRKCGYKTSGLFYENTNCNYDPEKLGGIFKCAVNYSTNSKDINNYINRSDVISSKKSIINFLGGEPTVIFCKNYLAPYLSKQIFPSSNIIYLVSGLNFLDRYYRVQTNNIMSAQDFLKKNDQKLLKQLNGQSMETYSMNCVNHVILNSKLTHDIFMKVYSEYKHKIYYEPIDTSECSNLNSSLVNKNLDGDKKYDLIMICSDFERKIKNNHFLLKFLNHSSMIKYTKLAIGSNSHIFKDIQNITIINLIPNNEIPIYLAQSKVMLFPSLFDANSNNIREALLSNCMPLISNNVGYYEKFPKYLVCEDYNVNNWMNKIHNLIDNCDQYLKITKVKFEVGSINKLLQFIY
jgi:glycosyltransferase involved in cell wall biosynthesis